MRLTKQIKNDIRDILIERAVVPKEKVLENKIHDFLLKVFWLQLSKTEYQLFQELKDSKVMHTYCLGYIHVECRSLGKLDTRAKNVVKYPYGMNTYLHYTNLNEQDKLTFKALIKEQDELEALRNSIIDNLNSLLNSCTTVKKLRELWENGNEVIDKALGQSQQSPTVYMPMLAVQTLDAIVPLP